MVEELDVYVLEVIEVGFWIEFFLCVFWGYICFVCGDL